MVVHVRLCHVPAEKMSLEKLTNTLGVPLGTAKQMVFKKRALLNMEVRQPDRPTRQMRVLQGVVSGITGY